MNCIALIDCVDKGQGMLSATIPESATKCRLWKERGNICLPSPGDCGLQGPTSCYLQPTPNPVIRRELVTGHGGVKPRSGGSWQGLTIYLGNINSQRFRAFPAARVCYGEVPNLLFHYGSHRFDNGSQHFCGVWRIVFVEFLNRIWENGCGLI